MTTSLGLVSGLSEAGGGLNALLTRGTINNECRSGLTSPVGIGCGISPPALNHQHRSHTTSYGPTHSSSAVSSYPDLGCGLSSYNTSRAVTSLSSESTLSAQSGNNRSALSQDLINNNHNGTSPVGGLLTPSSVAAALGEHFAPSGGQQRGSLSSLSSHSGGLELSPPHTTLQQPQQQHPSLSQQHSNNSSTSSQHSATSNMHNGTTPAHLNNNNYLFHNSHEAHAHAHAGQHHPLHGMLAPGPDGQSFLDLSPSMGHPSPPGGTQMSPVRGGSGHMVGPMYPWMAIVGKSAIISSYCLCGLKHNPSIPLYNQAVKLDTNMSTFICISWWG